MMCFVESYSLQLIQIIEQGLSTQISRVKFFCVSFDIHYEHIEIFCDLFGHPYLIFNWVPQRKKKILKIMSISGKSSKNFLILLMDVPGRIFRNQNRRNYVVKWILQNLISDYHRAMFSLSLGFNYNKTSVGRAIAFGCANR